MANENNNGGSRNSIDSEKKTRRLIDSAITAFSVSGYAPSESTWCFTPEQVIDIVTTYTKAYLEDLSDVDLDINYKTGEIAAFVWIPDNSRHICNNELKNSRSAINRKLYKHSKEINEFMDKFCLPSDKRIYKEETGLPKVGIRVQIDRFMRLELDDSGNEYAKAFGDRYRRNTRIMLQGIFSKGDDGRFGKLNYIKVTKSLKSSFGVSRKPRPKRSYNAH